jgi:hypothetical protein
MNKELVQLVSKVLGDLEKNNARLALEFHKIFLNAIAHDDENTIDDIAVSSIAALGNYVDIDEYKAMYNSIEDARIEEAIKDVIGTDLIGALLGRLGADDTPKMSPEKLEELLSNLDNADRIGIKVVKVPTDFASFLKNLEK